MVSENAQSSAVPDLLNNMAILVFILISQLTQAENVALCNDRVREYGANRESKQDAYYHLATNQNNILV